MWVLMKIRFFYVFEQHFVRLLQFGQSSSSEWIWIYIQYSAIHTNYPTGKWTCGSYTQSTFRNYRLPSGSTGLVSTYAVNCGAIMGRKQKSAELTCVWMNSEATIPPVHCIRPYQLNDTVAQEKTKVELLFGIRYDIHRHATLLVYAVESCIIFSLFFRNTK